MSPIPFPPEKSGDDKPSYHFWFNLAAQTAGGTIMATVVGLIGWRVSRPGPRL